MPNNVTPQDLLRLSKLPPSRVIAWFRRKGFAVSWDWREVWKDEHARAFTVAKATKQDILAELRRGVNSALSQGWSERRFIQEMTPVLQKLGWWGKKQVINPVGKLQLVQLGSPWRLKTIYRTNLLTSFSRGRYRTLKANVINRPYWMYDARNDSLTRPAHRDLDNKVYPADHPIWGRIYPPNGYNCRCIVRALTADQVKQKGLTIEDSPKLPDGFPDKGWNFNPAKQSVGQLAAKIEIKAPRRPAVPPKPSLQDLPDAGAPVLWEVFSSSGNVSAGKIKQVLSAIPGAEERVGKLYNFLNKQRTGSVFATSTETRPPWQKSSRYKNIENALGGYLSTISNTPRAYSSGSRTIGFTNQQWNHVVVRVRKGVTFDQINAEALPGLVDDVIKNSGTKPDWTFGWNAKNNPALTGKDADRFITWLHEIGHQVHYKAGIPVPPTRFGGLTDYSRTSNREFFAEHFVGWLLNRDAMVKWNKAVTEYIDRAIEKATLAANRTVPGG